MLQLLIVDDEIHAVEGIKTAVAWEKIGVSAVFTAFNIRQAKEVFINHHVDIMLCDIEMPQGSGLDLLAWVKKTYPKVKTIFLTCHADFRYAQQAIQLECMDYILKPVPFAELETAIAKAIAKITAENTLQEYSQYGQLWFKQQPVLIEKFWLDILNQTISSNPDTIRAAAVERNINYVEQQKLIPVLISVQRWHQELSPYDEKARKFALKNSCADEISGWNSHSYLLQLENGKLLTLLSWEDGSDDVSELLKQRFEAYIEKAYRYFDCDLSCYIGVPAYGHELPGIVTELLEVEKNNVAFNNRVFLLAGQVRTTTAIPMPDMSLWGVMLGEGSKDKVVAEVITYLEHSVQMMGLDADRLQQFHQDFLQMFYSVLKQKGIQAHQLFGDNVSAKFFAKAVCSLTDMIVWVKHILEKGMEYVNAVEESESVVEKVKKYITLHIGQELSREDIANNFYLNPDYLTRIFKKQTGLSIMEYLIRERLRIARELLLKTDMPVSAVAVQVGYTNFSHFAKMFKKFTDMNPNDFRRKG